MQVDIGSTNSGNADRTDRRTAAHAATSGDEDAFTALYRRRQGPIYRFALHMSGSPQVAEEVTQDVFVFLAQRGRDFDATRAPLGSVPVRCGPQLRSSSHGAQLF